MFLRLLELWKFFSSTPKSWLLLFLRHSPIVAVVCIQFFATKFFLNVAEDPKEFPSSLKDKVRCF